MSTSKPTLEVVPCGARGTNFAAILDSYQFKILGEILPCLHLQIHRERWKSLTGLFHLTEIYS